jgi:ubiquinone/menaquinone biosynthesis C-methylase UbiE
MKKSAPIPSKKGQADAYLAGVRRYWEKAHTHYLENVGTTFQAGRIKVGPGEDPVTGSNLYLASAAGIRPEHWVLDAGCGVCGPSIDIAGNIEGVRIAAITISPEQAATASERVRDAGLQNHIELLIGDFHRMPFAAGLFDVVCFFESSCYAHDLRLLFSEVRRVLRPGGHVYLKEVFRRDGPLSKEEKAELGVFDRTFASRTASMEEVAGALVNNGFTEVRQRDLSNRITTTHAMKAMFTLRMGHLQPTEFGKMHFHIYRNLPILYGDIKATRPRLEEMQ